MKKIAILTSMLALAACGGGSGGSGTSTARPMVVSGTIVNYHVPTNAERSANANNTNLTGMASEVMVTENKQATIDLVASSLGTDIYNTTTLSNVSSRSATRRAATVAGGRALTDDEKYYIAYNKLEKMEKTLKTLDSLSGAEFDAYVDEHKADVIEAFKLMGRDEAAADSDFADLLDTVKNGGTIEAAIGSVKPYSTVKIDEVKFKFAGEDKYAKFVIDDSGVITQVAQMNSDDTITEQGYFTRDTDAQGKLKTTFSKQMKKWSFPLGDWNGNTWFAGIPSGKGKITNLQMITETNAEPTKAQMKARIEALIDEFVNEQNGEAPTASDVTAIKEHYTGLIDAYDPYNVDPGVQNDLGRSHVLVDYSVSLTGLGTGLGLKYSDFGYAKMVEDGDEIYAPYSGGYSDLALNSITAMEKDVKFKGKAVAGVEVEDGRTGVKDAMLLVDNDAYLTLDKNGNKSTLKMEHLKDQNPDRAKKDWYTVTIEKVGTSSIEMTFDLDGKSATIDDAFKFNTADANGVVNHTFTDGWNALEGRYENVIDDNTMYGGSADIQYYSPDKTQANVAEAGATFGFSENQHWDHEHSGGLSIGEGEEIQRELSMYGAFGGKKQ